MYIFLDYFFLLFHTTLILFNVLGWIWKKTRKINLITLFLTGASWFILGVFYGIGYCPITDWHWNVLRKLGKTDLPYSYIKYLVERLSGFSVNAALVEHITLFGFLAALSISIYLNIIHPRIKKLKKK